MYKDDNKDCRFNTYILEGLSEDEIEQREYDYLESISIDDGIVDIISYVRDNEPIIYKRYVEEKLDEAEVYCLLTISNLARVS